MRESEKRNKKHGNELVVNKMKMSKQNYSCTELLRVLGENSFTVCKCRDFLYTFACIGNNWTYTNICSNTFFTHKPIAIIICNNEKSIRTVFMAPFHHINFLFSGSSGGDWDSNDGVCTWVKWHYIG